MIKRQHISRIWKRTVAIIILVDLVAVAILASLVAKGTESSHGLATMTIVMLFGALSIASIALYYAVRFVRDRIAEKFGED